MHIDLEWPRILTPSYWFPKEQSPRCIESVSIRNIIVREDGEPDCLIAVLVIDNADVDQDDPEYLDLTQLRQCLSSNGTFFPWTCSCGVPGCAGMFRGVLVSHDGATTTWLDRDTDRHWEFSTSMLRVAFDEAIIDGSRLLASAPGLEVTPDQNVVEYRVNVE